MKRRHKGQGSIYKAGESWAVAISMGYDKTTGKRVRLKLTAPTKKEAQAILKDIEVLRDDLGKPIVNLSNKIYDIIGKRNFKIYVSISHSNDNAIAYSIMEEV